MKTWEELTELEQAQLTYWDMYKDAYGFRPRGIDTSAWTIEDYNQEFAVLEAVIAKEIEHQRKIQAAAVVEFELEITELQVTGLNRLQAIEQLHNKYKTGLDDDYLCYRLNLPYGYINGR